jgi:CheY-like chemotaxis protein
VHTEEPIKGEILIVDDDDKFTEALGGALESVGYHVIVRRSGPEALKAVDEMRDRIDLAVIDVVLPGMSGFEVVGAIKRRPNSIKIVVTSLVMRELYLEVAKTFGAHAVVRKRKEFHGQEWLTAIEEVLRDVRAQKANP